MLPWEKKAGGIAHPTASLVVLFVLPALYAILNDLGLSTIAARQVKDAQKQYQPNGKEFYSILAPH